jgi:hypothetical protein
MHNTIEKREPKANYLALYGISISVSFRVEVLRHIDIDPMRDTVELDRVRGHDEGLDSRCNWVVVGVHEVLYSGEWV